VAWSTFALNGQRKYLTRSEADRFLTTAKKRDLSVYVFCWFIAASGCRISEALMVTTKCVDFEAGAVILESLKKRRKFVYRAIPLPASLLDRLAELIATSEFGDDDRLWPWSRMTGYRRVTEVMREADIAGSWATPKGLRHGFGVRAVQSGAPLHLVQRWLGHADMKTTAIYAAAVGPEEREMASRTWLDDDDEVEKGLAATRNGLIRDSVARRSKQSNLDRHLNLEPKVVKAAEKRWFRQIFSKAETIFSCQLLQFYLFCNRLFL